MANTSNIGRPYMAPPPPSMFHVKRASQDCRGAIREAQSSQDCRGQSEKRSHRRIAWGNPGSASFPKTKPPKKRIEQILDAGAARDAVDRQPGNAQFLRHQP